MVALFTLLGAKSTNDPAIVYYPFGTELGDDPELHRWRAMWDRPFCGDTVSIEVRAYPVVRRTHCGAWIDPHAYPQRVSAERWVTEDPGHPTLKWVSDDGAQAWAKPTREDAIHSLAVRLTRWSMRLKNDVEKARSSVKTLRYLRPDLKVFADTASVNLKLLEDE